MANPASGASGSLSAWDAGVGYREPDNAGMDSVINWLDTEFPPGWFDGLKFTDWLSVVNLILVGLLGKKTLGPRRKTKLEVTAGYGPLICPLNGEEYHRLVVINNGHFPAHGVILERESYSGLSTHRLGDIDPWQIKKTSSAIRNYEGAKFVATYLDADNKLTKQRLKLGDGYISSPKKDNGRVSSWESYGKTWPYRLSEALDEWQRNREAKRDALQEAKKDAIRNAKRRATRKANRNAKDNTLD